MPQTTEASLPRPGRVVASPCRTISTLLRRPVLPLLALVLAACTDLTGVEEVRNEMLPPSTYQALWDRVEACSGRVGDFRRLRWYWVRAFPEDSAALGQWNGRHEITLTLVAVENGVVVAHELLHDLLGGDPAHTDPAWDACGIPRGDG